MGYNLGVMSINSFYHRKLFLFISICLSMIFLDLLLTFLSKKIIKTNKSNIYREHPVYHHTFKKLKKATLGFRGKKYTIFTNSLGFKDKQARTVDLSSKNFRLLLIGDSFTEGVGLPYEKTFAGIIAKELSIYDIELLNAGRASYSPIIYWRKIKHLIENIKLEIDEVVVYIDISDAQDEALVYEITDNLVVKSRKRQENANDKFTFKYFIRDNTTVMYYISNYLYDMVGLNTAERKWRVGIETKKTNLFNKDRSRWTFDKQVYNHYGRDGVKLMLVYMTKLHKILNEHCIKLTVAVYPWPQQILNGDLDSLQVRIWDQWCSENKVGFINYFPELIAREANYLEKANKVKQYYFHNDVHFNEAGNQLIAEKFIKLYKKNNK
jgi:hypothetical protein